MAAGAVALVAFASDARADDTPGKGDAPKAGTAAPARQTRTPRGGNRGRPKPGDKKDDKKDADKKDADKTADKSNDANGGDATSAVAGAVPAGSAGTTTTTGAKGDAKGGRGGRGNRVQATTDAARMQSGQRSNTQGPDGSKPEREKPAQAAERESRIEFDERTVSGQSATGAVYLFQRSPSEFKSIVDVPDSFRARTLQLLSSRGENK
jgi:hypothetical protein